MPKDINIILGDGTNLISCPLCQDSFSWKRSTGVRYKAGDATKGFIVCEDCFDSADFKGICQAKEYYEKLWGRKIELFLPIQTLSGVIKSDLN